MPHQGSKKEEINRLVDVLLSGIDLNYGRLSLCDLMNYRYTNVRNNRRWQIYCDDSRVMVRRDKEKVPYSMIYDEIRPAVIKFLELKKKIKRVH